MTGETIALGVGTELVWEGQRLTVSKRIAGHLVLIDLEGNELPPLSIKTVAQTLISEENPPEDQPGLHELESRLTSVGGGHLARDRMLFALVDTGVPLGAAPGTRPDAELDPATVPLNKRLRTLALREAAQRNIDVGSARKQITRRLRLRQKGLGALVHGRYWINDTTYHDPRIVPILTEWLKDQVPKSTVPGSTLFEAFRGHLRIAHPDIPHDKFGQETFRNRCSEIYTLYPHYKNKAATRRSAENRNEATYNKRKVTRPGEVWLIDTTTVNVELWDPHQRGKKDTFRPVLTMIIDFATRMVVGYSLTEKTGEFAVGLALAHAFASMVDQDTYVEIYGKRIPRPYVEFPRALVSHPIFPEALVSDNGMDYTNFYQTAQLERLTMDFEPGRRLSPDDKAEIERFFLTLKWKFEALIRGFTGGSVDERGESPEADAVVTYQEYLRRLDRWVDLYNFRVHEGITLEDDPHRDVSPYEMWVHLADRNGITEVKPWKNEWIKFLPSWAGTISTDGVSYKDLMYNAPVLKRMKTTPGLAIKGKHRFYRNPSDLRHIYCFDPDGHAKKIPWAGLTDMTPEFGEYMNDMVRHSFDDLHVTKKQYQDRIVEWLVEAHRIDEENEQLRSVARSRHEEMLDFNLDRVRRVDTGVISEDPPATAPAPVVFTVAPPAPRPAISTRRPKRVQRSDDLDYVFEDLA